MKDIKNNQMSENQNKKLAIIMDLGDLQARAFYSFENLKKMAKHRDLNRGYLFVGERIVTALRWLVKDRPAVIIGVEDRYCKWRKEVHPGYKETRTSTTSKLLDRVIGTFKEYGWEVTREDFKIGVYRNRDLLKDFLKDNDVKSFHIDGFEADDLASLIAGELEAQGYDEVVIFSMDADYVQLLNGKGKRTLFRFIPGQKPKILENNSVYSWREIGTILLKEPIVVYPCHAATLKSLLGDKSDEIPPIKKGLGPGFYKYLWKTIGLESLLGNPNPEAEADTLFNLIKEKLPTLPPKIQKGAQALLDDPDSKKNFIRNYRIVCLHPTYLKSIFPEETRVVEEWVKSLKTTNAVSISENLKVLKKNGKEQKLEN